MFLLASVLTRLYQINLRFHLTTILTAEFLENGNFETTCKIKQPAKLLPEYQKEIIWTYIRKKIVVFSWCE